MNHMYFAAWKLIASRHRNWRDEEGATAAEYALLVSLIAVVIIGSVAVLGQQLSTVFSDLTDGFTQTVVAT